MTNYPPLRIATRASQLALWQANHVAALLRAAAPERAVEIVHVSTAGDRDQSEPIRTFGGMGIFTREVQNAVLDQRADLAVHSLKDLPTDPVPGLCLVAVPTRADVSDALVFPQSSGEAVDLDSLPHSARVGTGSLRRQAQLLHARPDFKLLEVRGNVETRLRKLDALECDALVLAVAGLTRLGLADRIRFKLTPPLMLAAVGQGALGIECRTDDWGLREILARIEDPVTRRRVTAERELLADLRGGCLAPIGVHTHLEPDGLVLEAVVLSADGRQRLWSSAKSAGDPLLLGRQVAADLRSQGADFLIQQSRKPA